MKDENLKTSDTTEAESLEKSSKFQNTPSDFGDYFHERDRLDHNNIVDEVKTSFLEYSMSVIKSRAFTRFTGWFKTRASENFMEYV